VTEINQFDDDSIFAIAKTVQRLRAQVENLQRQLRRIPKDVPTHEIRTGKMKAKAGETYPAEGCVLPVQFQDVDFDEITGVCPDLDTYVWPKKFVVARSYNDRYIPEDTDVLIVKVAARKGRRWIIIPRSATSCDVVRFKIVTADPANYTAYVRVQSIPAGCTPGQIPDSTLDSEGALFLDVCDPMMCMLNEPAADLVDRSGWAHYQLPLLTNVCQTNPDTLEPHWEIVSLCCPEC